MQTIFYVNIYRGDWGHLIIMGDYVHENYGNIKSITLFLASKNDRPRHPINFSSSGTYHICKIVNWQVV